MFKSDDYCDDYGRAPDVNCYMVLTDDYESIY